MGATNLQEALASMLRNATDCKLGQGSFANQGCSDPSTQASPSNRLHEKLQDWSDSFCHKSTTRLGTLSGEKHLSSPTTRQRLFRKG